MIHQKFGLWVLCLFFLAGPALVSAQSAQVPSVNIGTTAADDTLTSRCRTPFPSVNLRIGMRGSAVVDLQNFLKERGYTMYATGYFGPITWRAVARFQAASGVPPTGYVGPLTRAAASRICGGTTPSISFTAAPTSGPAPLGVSFAGNGVSGGSQYIIDYGDGANSGPLAAIDVCMHLVDGSGGCPRVKASHTYAAPGTYQAMLQKYIACMWSNPRCLIATVPIGIVTITVTPGFSTGTTSPAIRSITPALGPVGTTVILMGDHFTPTGNIVHFGNGAIGGVSASVVQGVYLLTFAVPASVGPYCPPGTMCAMYLQSIQPGIYDVSVENANGRSEAVAFTVTSGNAASQ